MTRPERIPAAVAAAIVGAPLRTVQALAARGELPSAARIAGRWTFNEAALRAWVFDQERETCKKAERPRAAIGGNPRFGAASRSRAVNIDGAFELTIQKLRRRGDAPKRTA